MTNSNQELFEKKKKAERLVREFQKLDQNKYIPVVIEALGFYVKSIETILEEESKREPQDVKNERIQ